MEQRVSGHTGLFVKQGVGIHTTDSQHNTAYTPGCVLHVFAQTLACIGDVDKSHSYFRVCVHNFDVYICQVGNKLCPGRERNMSLLSLSQLFPFTFSQRGFLVVNCK